MSHRAISLASAAFLPALMLAVLSACAADAPETPEKADAAEDKADVGPKLGRRPHVTFDVKNKQVRVDCESLDVETPLEFFCVRTNTAEHEAVLRTPAKPSDIHFALLAIGLEPGEPVKYSEALNKWFPPRGPPLQIRVEWEKDGRTVSHPANRLMRNMKTKKEMPPLTWIFAGSRMMKNVETGDEAYAADGTGYVVSVVNFDLTVIDIPQLASNSNELLEWERNPTLVPPRGTKAVMVIEPAGGLRGADEAGGGGGEAAPAKGPGRTKAAPAPPEIDMPLVKVDADGHVAIDDHPVTLDELTGVLETMKAKRPVKAKISAAPGLRKDYLELVQAAVEAADVQSELEAPPADVVAAAVKTDVPPAEGADAQESPEADGGDDGDGRISEVTADEREIKDLVARWERAVRPHRKALQAAAQAHYDTISALRREQQRLIDEADRIQRAIDRLEREYNDSITPHPPVENATGGDGEEEEP